jgi:hypothetical protein
MYVNIQLADVKEFVSENILKEFARKSTFQNVPNLCECTFSQYPSMGFV